MSRSVELTKRDYSKRWVFTWNNYTDDSEEKLKEFSNECEWLIYGKEEAPETGTKHLQGFIHLKKRVRGSYLINKFEGVWFNKAAGNNDQNEKYTKKEGNYVEYGSKPMTGSEKTKVKWKNAKQAAIEGRYDDIPEDLYVRYVKNFEHIHAKRIKVEDRTEWTNNDLHNHRLWLWGPTGSGKTHFAKMFAKKMYPDLEECTYLKTLNKWIDGFENQKIMIIDDVDPDGCQHLGRFFKQWGDKWSSPQEIKGGKQDFVVDYVIVTSNYPIDACFNATDADPIHRRFFEHELKHMGEPFDWPPNVNDVSPSHTVV